MQGTVQAKTKGFDQVTSEVASVKAQVLAQARQSQE